MTVPRIASLILIWTPQNKVSLFIVFLSHIWVKKYLEKENRPNGPGDKMASSGHH
jgi:hypothetical protein